MSNHLALRCVNCEADLRGRDYYELTLPYRQPAPACLRCGDNLHNPSGDNPNNRVKLVRKSGSDPGL